MSFPAPLSVSPVNNNTNQDYGLRAYQRVTAQVMSVTDTTAVLEIDGQPVVAQLLSADQAAALSSQRTAQFLVTQLTDKAVTLKFLKDDSTPVTGPAIHGPDLATRLLEQSNLPVNVSSLMVARAMLKQHLPVTPESMDELLSALSTYGPWSDSEADLAAAMKSAGLPVSAQSLSLASRPPARMTDSLSRLTSALKQASTQGVPEETLQQLQSSLQELDGLFVKGDGENSAQQLKALVDALGRSLENLLLEQNQNPEAPISKNGLMSLVTLQRQLEQAGQHEAAHAIADFLNDMRQGQLMNSKPEALPSQGVWSEIGLALRQAEDKFSSARLRIAHEANDGRINPTSTRLILQVEVEPGETVEVDLSLAGKQLRTSVTAPDSAWCQQAEAELPSLAEALNELGYALKDTHFRVDRPRPFSRIQVAAGGAPLLTVNIEV